MPTLHDRIQGGLLGLLVGDALGVPYEFKWADQLPALEDIELVPPPGFPRSHAGVEPGTWSDDGAQALCLLDSLLFRGRMDMEDFGRRLVNWLDWGHMAVGGHVFDVGVQTMETLSAIREGTPIALAGRRDVAGNGNGSLMRVLPLALWHRGSDEELVRDARLSSSVTHAHARAQLCCALYCLWARRILHQHPEPWADAAATLRRLLVDDAAELEELERHVRPDDLPEGTGSGYVVNTLHSARMVLEQQGYENVVKAAVALGNDTDTTAAVAGGIAGVRDGVQGIPERWQSALLGMELVRPLLEKLLARW